ncbi:hypothetical protein ABZ570_15790 [Micromonospora sp. NPDC007271]|uniref:hypothetical protein n=1 Tax=Micromonospora sp. NPDC007271 TaxID=3154587 RepID=UPI0033EB5342
MGILDHRRTWHFTLAAPPDECINAFLGGLAGKKGFQLLRSQWEPHRGTAHGLPTASGTYRGRSGAIGAVTSMSRRATEEQEAAIGSVLSFQVTGHDSNSGRTRCSMAMTRTGRVFLFFTPDARFFRAAMNRVAHQLRAVDANLTMTKS